MYINPFLAGVIATLIAEIGTMFIASLIIILKRGKRNGN
jgi:hypothetical protein